ncbi:MAG TPA: hypothetical protein VMW69_14715 [Spirochaetia bacterium]|nr:hypothetical protein [Spirochaetia bacterium]
MPIFDFTNGKLSPVDRTDFGSEGVLERSHLQAALKNQIDIVCPDCLVIAEELSEWEDSRRRVDLLAVDREGMLVVIELKRTETGEHMELQALRYAAMLSTLTFDRTVEIYSRYLKRNSSEIDAEQHLCEFLGWDDPHDHEFPSDIRIVLVSSGFSTELTTAVMWLNTRGLDIRCVQLIPHKHGAKLLVETQQIIPLPQAEQYQVRLREKSEERRRVQLNQKDFTRYQFEGGEYNKRKLVLAVIKAWVRNNKPKSIDELTKAFPQQLHAGTLFVPAVEARETYRRQGIARHFLEGEELFDFPDGGKYAVSNQWGVSKIVGFVDHARELGLEIEEVE